MTKRTDIHSPSNFIPGDYEVLDHFGVEKFGTYDRGDGEADIEGWVYGSDAIDAYDDADTSANPHPDLNQCDLCGTWFIHGAVLSHSKGDVISIGGICLDEIALVGGISKNERISRTRRENGWAIKAAKIRRFLASAPDGIVAALRADHNISRDLRAQAISRGRLSDKQIELAFKLVADVAKREANRADEPELAPVPEVSERIRITAKLVHQKNVDGYYGQTLKGLFLCDAGHGRAFKLWGTVPQAVVDAEYDYQAKWGLWPVDVAPTVSFTARVERSSDDKSFGFFKRPTKVEVEFPEPEPAPAPQCAVSREPVGADLY